MAFLLRLLLVVFCSFATSIVRQSNRRLDERSDGRSSRRLNGRSNGRSRDGSGERSGERLQDGSGRVRLAKKDRRKSSGDGSPLDGRSE